MRNNLVRILRTVVVSRVALTSDGGILGRVPRGARLPGALLLGVVATAVLAFSIINLACADTTPQPPPLSQNWTNTDLITANDNWSGVPGIVGYEGDNLTTVEGTDLRTITASVAAATPTQVNANKGNPSAYNAGGNTEFDSIPNPTVAFQGTGQAAAPHLVLALNATGQSNVRISYNVRDIDAGSNSAVAPVALQYRVGNTGAYTNVPAGYIPNATTGPT